MGNVYLNEVFIPDPITAPPPAPVIPPPSELPVNLRLNPVGGIIRGGEPVEIYSYGRLKDPNRDDSFSGSFTRNWSTSGKLEFFNSGLSLSSTNGTPTTITHPTNDFRYFTISVDFALNVDSLSSQDFFSLKFFSGSNELLIRVARRDDLNIVQAEAKTSSGSRFGSFQDLTSRFGTLTISKSQNFVFALLDNKVIFSSDFLPDVTGQVQISALSQNIEDTSVVLLSNFRDEPAALFGDRYLINQELLDDYSIRAITPRVPYEERGLKDVTLFGRFGVFTKSEAWNYYLPVGKSLKGGGSFSSNFYGDNGSI
jgi:hypothetical protein